MEFDAMKSYILYSNWYLDNNRCRTSVYKNDQWMDTCCGVEPCKWMSTYESSDISKYKNIEINYNTYSTWYR